MKYSMDINVYDKKEAHFKYLVRGINDSFWTDNIQDAFKFIMKQLKEAKEEK